jgi:hypothetical protein
MVSKIKRVWVPLAAAAVTAAAFAAVSVAQDDDKSGGEPKGDVFLHRAGPELSDEQRAKIEEFRSCMEENGAPAPPEPPTRDELESGEMPAPPEPPTAEQRESIEKALKACEDLEPEGFEMHIGPGGPGVPCGPPPGEHGERRDGAQS